MADNSLPPGSARRIPGRLLALRAADVQLYRICDDLSGVLIFPMVIFSPWAFGTTQPWSIGTMNLAGCALGVLLLAKLFIRRVKGFRPPRWENFSRRSGWTTRRRDPVARLLTRTLAGLTVAILLYCLTSAWNAAATYHSGTRLFEYHHYLHWLPHSLDSHRTWSAFWMYLGLAGSFWGIRDWLSGMTLNEERALHRDGENEKPPPALPERLRRLLWVLCVNGAALGVEAIAQRASGSGKLLFLVQPRVNPEGESQFGPYAYRANAAQYFNLLWPLCLGFWWTLHRTGGLRGKAHHLLLFCAAIMAACPVISSSRGGALVAAGILILAVVFLTVTNLFGRTWRLPDRRARWGTTATLGLFFALAVALGLFFGWDSLEPRLEQISGGLQNREKMYDAARPMAGDYPLFGTGAGTFGTVFQLYRVSNATYWPEQLHNDWLETRITFGWFGLALLLAALACAVLRWLAPGGIRGGRRFVILTWFALAGCLVHARFDFPFQIHSIVFLFLLICAVLFSLGRRPGGSRR
ncbi:MAG: O-antigen ligase family protein [Verrucomicrobiota bacterium]